MSSIKDMAARMKSKLEAARRIPEQSIAEAEKFMMPLLPVYTGAYLESIEVKRDGDSAMIYLDLNKLIGNSSTEYVYEIAHPRFGKPGYPGGPYPLRIEEHGALLSSAGQGAWALAEYVTRSNIQSRLQEVAR